MVNVLVRVVDGSSCNIELPSSASINDLKLSIERITCIPSSDQIIKIGSRILHNTTPVCDLQHDQPIFATLLLSLLGGKGGFGTLLRTSARADTAEDRGDMRDLQGRRLRDVEQMKELEEWKRKNAHLSEAEKKEREREYRAKLAEIERNGGRERKQCKYGADCRYQSTSCKFYHPDEEKHSDDSHQSKRARTSGPELRSRVDSDSDDEGDADDDVFAVHSQDEEKARALSSQSTKPPSIQPSKAIISRAFDEDDLLGFDSHDESVSPISSEFSQSSTQQSAV